MTRLGSIVIVDSESFEYCKLKLPKSSCDQHKIWNMLGMLFQRERYKLAKIIESPSRKIRLSKLLQVEPRIFLPISGLISFLKLLVLSTCKSSLEYIKIRIDFLLQHDLFLANLLDFAKTIQINIYISLSD